MVIVTLEGLWMVSDRIVDFQFFFKFHRSGPAKIFNLWTLTEHVSYASKKAPNQGKDLINMVRVSLEELWMVSDSIVDFQFFVKFHRSGPAIIFSFWSLTETCLVYASKKAPNLAKDLINMVECLLWKDLGWFLIELSIFDFSSNFTGSDL